MKYKLLHQTSQLVLIRYHSITRPKLFTYEQYTNGELHQWLVQKYMVDDVLSPCSTFKTKLHNKKISTNSTNSTSNVPRIIQTQVEILIQPIQVVRVVHPQVEVVVHQIRVEVVRVVEIVVHQDSSGGDSGSGSSGGDSGNGSDSGGSGSDSGWR